MSACIPNVSTYSNLHGVELHHITGVQWRSEVMVAVQDAASYFYPLFKTAAEETVSFFTDRTFLKLNKADGS